MQSSDSGEVEFNLNGKPYKLTRQQVIQGLAGKTPGRARSLLVEVEGQLYPVKQAFSAAAKLDIADFNSHVARDQLKKLGFRVLRVHSE